METVRAWRRDAKMEIDFRRGGNAHDAHTLADAAAPVKKTCTCRRINRRGNYSVLELASPSDLLASVARHEPFMANTLNVLQWPAARQQKIPSGFFHIVAHGSRFPRQILASGGPAAALSSDLTRCI
jgi:hypothetical protein